MSVNNQFTLFLKIFAAPVEDNTGCSDSDSIVCSEFSSTPATSVYSTPEPSPIKRRRVEPPLKGHTDTKGKDLSDQETDHATSPEECPESEPGTTQEYRESADWGSQKTDVVPARNSGPL